MRATGESGSAMTSSLIAKTFVRSVVSIQGRRAPGRGAHWSAIRDAQAMAQPPDALGSGDRRRGADAAERGLLWLMGGAALRIGNSVHCPRNPWRGRESQVYRRTPAGARRCRVRPTIPTRCSTTSCRATPWPAWRRRCRCGKCTRADEADALARFPRPFMSDSFERLYWYYNRPRGRLSRHGHGDHHDPRRKRFARKTLRRSRANCSRKPKRSSMR